MSAVVDTNVLLDVITRDPVWIFIGAHAQVEQLPLLTRDAKRFRTYFPTVDLIVPTT